ncbi:unnamed protein product [Hymenolepis diminuta]|uniref:Dynactin domain-containing protein n=2 Tax=Hymenolepis diminuta TaxID=6216 RepID=A0A0R3SYN9_HYMDI|nr:unnamed protein product [Hymenolepis diminuta]
MSTISADECYSNVDSLEELRRICGERDGLVSKLKLLLVRKNKTISSLEEEISLLKSGKSFQPMDTQSELNTKIDNSQLIVTRQQAELDLCKRELETLSKMNNDLQKSLSVVKQERDTFKSEVARIMNDLVTVNARTTELYGVASKISQLPPKITHSNSHGQHAFILSTLKSVCDNNLTGYNKPTAALLNALQDVNSEINQLLGVKDHSPSVKTFDEVQKLLEHFSTSLKQYQSPKTAFNVDKNAIIAVFNNLSKDRNELRSSVTSFSQRINSSLQNLLSSIQNLQDSSSQPVNNDALLKVLSKFKDNLGEMKEVISQNNSIMAEDSSNLVNRIGSILSKVQKSSYKITLDDSVLTDPKLKSTLSVLPHLQKDVCDIKSSVRHCFASLQTQLNNIQRLHTKLVLALNTLSPPPPYSKNTETPRNSTALESLLTDVWQLKDCLSETPRNSTALESLLTDVWQLKDCLSGMKDLVLEQSSRYHRNVKEINSQHDKLLQNLKDEIVNMRAVTFDIRKEAEAEIDQLRETCDRFSDECDRFGALREALRLMIIQKTPSVNLTGLNSEDAGLLNDLAVRFNHNQAARLELFSRPNVVVVL